MRGINKVILVGNVGRDPEVRSFAGGGGTLTTVSLATSEQWKDKNTGQMTEQTEWHRVVFYGRLAEIAAEYVRKGSKIYVEGSLHTRKWQDKNTGQDRYSTEIKAQNMQLLDGRSGGGGQASAPDNDYGYGQDDYQQSSRPARPAAAPANNRPAPAQNSDFDDDLPF
jgi:single-strand DNA-binding protein